MAPLLLTGLRLRQLSAFIGAFAALLSLPAVLSAQGHPVADAAGFKDNRTYLSELPGEHVDTLSGSLVLSFTDLVLPGNAGRDLVFQRTYNSKDESGGPHWTFGPAGMVMSIDNPAGPFDAPTQYNFLPRFHTSDGAEHSSAWLDQINFTSLQTIYDTSRWVITARFWRFDRIDRRLYMPDGYFCDYEPLPANGTALKVVDCEDPFGNSLAFTYDGQHRLASVTQNLGGQTRVVTFDYDGAPDTMPRFMDYGSRRWTYTYQPGFRSPLISSVTPPAGPGWSYTYGNPSNTVDEIASMTTPRGGTVTYTFDTHEFGRMQDAVGQTRVPSRVLKTRTVGGRDIAPGTTIYTYQNAATGEQTTVESPSGTRTRYLHAPLGAVAYTPSVGGDWGVVQRIVEEPHGSGSFELEREDLAFTALPIGTQTHTATFLYTLFKRTIRRGNRTYVTEHTFRSTNFGDFHRPWTTTETGEITRVTTRTYFYGFNAMPTRAEPRILGALASEDVTVGGETFTKSWQYNAGTGFMISQSIYGQTTAFAPDGSGNVGTVSDAKGHATSFGYSWGVNSSVSPPILGSAISRVVNTDGTIASQTINTRTTTFEYDALGRQTKETPPVGAFIVTSYDNTGGAWVEQTRGATFTRTSLDGFGRPIRTEDAAGVKTDIQYDAEGRRTAQSLPYTSEPQRRWVSFAYDGLGRLTQRTTPDDRSITHTYTGSDIAIEDEEGRVTRHLRQSFGDPNEARLLRVIDAAGKSFHYTYNATGKLRTVTAPNLSSATQRVFTYNAKNELISEKHPESGTTTYTYDLDGKVETKTDATNTTLTYAYDDNDRVSTITSGGHTKGFGYEPGSNLRTGASSNFVNSSFSYDTGGRLETRTDSFESQSFTTSYTYDALDNLDTLTYPNGRVVQYGYDAANRITSVTDVSPGHPTKVYASGFTYHPSGALASYLTGNNVLTTIDIDPSRLWTTEIEADLPTAQPDLRIQYAYDGVGNVTNITEPVNGGYNQTFQYDRLDRMTRATGYYGVLPYGYDDHGNQTQPGRTYDANTLRLTGNTPASPQNSLWTFGYDAAGRQTTQSRLGTTWINNYNAYGMQTSQTVNTSTVAQYDYDADDLRKISRTDNHLAPNSLRTYYVHGLGQLLAEYQRRGTGAIASTHDYIYAGSRLIASVKPTLTTPYVEWTTLSVTVAESAGTHTPRVRLRVPAGGPIAAPLTVGFRVDGGPGNGNEVYDPTGGGFIATFPIGSVDGAEQNMYPLQIIQDNRNDDDEETVIISLWNVSGGRIGARSRQSLTVVDDDPMPVLNITGDQAVTEGSTVNLTITPTAQSNQPIFVDWYLSDPTGCGASIGGVVEIAAGFFNATLSVPIPLNGYTSQGTRLVQVFLANPRGATIGDGQATLTVTDADTPVTMDLTKPGHYLANVRGPGTDILALGNPYGVDVPLTLTWFFGDGGVLRQLRTLPARRRDTIDLAALFGTCATGVSVAVQVPTSAQLVSVEHAGAWGDTASRASEGVQPAAAWHFAAGTTADAQENITVLNPNNAAVTAKLQLFGATGAISVHTQTVPARGRYIWDVNALAPNVEHGATVSATLVSNPATAAVIVVDRTVTWNDGSEGYSSPGVSAPQYQAHLAGGEVGPEVSTTLSLLSLSDNDTTITVEYIHENGVTYPQLLTLVARHRQLVEPLPGLPAGTFGYRITSDPSEPFVAERTMHSLPTPRGASAAVAVAQPSAIRGFAEGMTGEADTVFWVLNPSTVQATVVFEFFDPDGTRLARHSVAVPAGSRRDVVVNEIEGMSWQTAFHTIVSSAIPVVTERATYWPGSINGIPTPEVPLRASAHVSNGWEIAAWYTGPRVYFDPTSSSVAENGGSAAPMLRVSTPLATPLDAPVTVTFTTTGGEGQPGAGPYPATPGDDYTPTTGTIVFPAGWISGDGMPIDPAVPIVNDQTDEFDETFKIAITDVNGGIANTSDVHQITIADDEPDETVYIDDGYVPENGGYIDVRLRTGRPSGRTIRIGWRTRSGTALGGVHFAWRTGIAVLRPGYRFVWLRIPINNDSLPPGCGACGGGVGTRHFYIDLDPPENGALDRPGGVVIIEDDEPPSGGGGTPPPIDPTPPAPGAFFADATAREGVLDYLLISNPNTVPIVARVTYVRPDGSMGGDDFELQPQQRTTVEVRNLPDMLEEDVSIAVQAHNPLHAVDADHAVYWGAGLQVGRATEGVMPSPEWHFAEGTTGGSFKETITVFNPNPSPVDVRMDFMLPNGTVYTHPLTIATGPGRVKVDVNDVLGLLAGVATDHSTRVTAEFVNVDPENEEPVPAPIVVERTIRWGDPDDVEAHSTPGVPAPSTTWFFAEGETGQATYIALGNHNSFATSAEITYLHENGSQYTQIVPIGALSRVTVQPPGTVPSGAFGFTVTTPEDEPIVVERMMYSGVDWTVGTAGVGSPVTSTVWRFSEGASGFWAAYMLIANPSVSSANVRLTFYKEDGTSVVHDIVVPPGSRQDVDIHTLTGMSGVVFRTVVESTNGVPIVAERSMYWSLLDPMFTGSHVTMGRPQ